MIDGQRWGWDSWWLMKIDAPCAGWCFRIPRGKNGSHGTRGSGVAGNNTLAELMTAHLNILFVAGAHPKTEILGPRNFEWIFPNHLSNMMFSGMEVRGCLHKFIVTDYSTNHDQLLHTHVQPILTKKNNFLLVLIMFYWWHRFHHSFLKVSWQRCVTASGKWLMVVHLEPSMPSRSLVKYQWW